MVIVKTFHLPSAMHSSSFLRLSHLLLTIIDCEKAVVGHFYRPYMCHDFILILILNIGNWLYLNNPTTQVKSPKLREVGGVIWDHMAGKQVLDPLASALSTQECLQELGKHWL